MTIRSKYDKINKSGRDKQDKLISSTIDIAMGDDIINFSKISKVGRDKVIQIMESYLD